jgi:uncharacterized protein (TIGR03437 family)
MRIPLAVVFSAVVLNAAQLPLPYSVTTVAGGTFVGDGGLATSGSLMDAEGICIDGAGNIYIADAVDNRVRMIAPTGIISTIAGTGMAGPLNSPYGVAADGKGNVYVADLGNNRIQKIAPGGAATTVLGQLASPRNVLVDSAGNVYFSEFGGHRVRRIGTDGTVAVIAGTGTAGSTGDGGPAVQAQLNYPAGLAMDLFGSLYIADSGNNEIRKVSGGRISTISAGALSTPTSVAVDAVGSLYVADSGNQRIRKLTTAGAVSTIPVAARDIALDAAGNLLAADGAHVFRVLTSGAVTTIAGDGGYLFRGDGGPATQARMNAPSGVALDGNGNIWIADTGNGRIRFVSSGGEINTVAGGPGQLSSPLEIAFDTSGDLYIADAAGFRIRELLSSQSALVTAAGTGMPGAGSDGLPGTSSPLNVPAGVATGAGGVIYVADTGNNRVRRMYASGVLVTIAGNGQSGFNGDGAGQGVELHAPAGICLDAAGNLYIADSGNNRIRKQTPDGVVTTIAGPDQLNGPRGVAVDAAGNVWIADTGNHRVVVLPAGGVLTVVADQLQSPVGLTVDGASGAVYVADAGSNLVLRLSPGPAALTQLPTPVSVVNAATLMNGPVAPGSLISVFGAGLANAAVLFDGQAAPVLMAQDTRLNVQVPLSAAGAFEVDSGNAALLTTMLTIVPSAPGVFTGPGGTGPVAAANQDGTVNSDANPALQGSVVTFYATGTGQGAVSVLIGGAEAQVLFAGDAPGFVGVMQINAQVPVGIASGTLPLVVQAGTALSQSGVTIAVR